MVPPSQAWYPSHSRGGGAAPRQNMGTWISTQPFLGSGGGSSMTSVKEVQIDSATATPEATLPADLTWENIVEQHSARVYRLAYHLTGNKHDAEDLTQDVFIRVFNSLSQYKPGTFEGWLHRITTNLFLDRVRRKKRIRFDFMADDDAAVPTSDSFDRHERSGQPED